MTDPEIRAAMLCAREEYIQAIRADMLGPGSEFSLPDAEHELIASPPAARYSLGILFPQGNLLRHDGDETITEDESLNESAAPELSPASYGLGDVRSSCRERYRGSPYDGGRTRSPR